MDASAAAFGLQIETDDDEPDGDDEPNHNHEIYYLWPCNVQTWNLWWRIQTLWRIGMQGREGLDYAGVTVYLREVVRLPLRRFAQVFRELQAMERAALAEWDKQRAEKQARQ